MVVFVFKRLFFTVFSFTYHLESNGEFYINTSMYSFKPPILLHLVSETTQFEFSSLW